MIVAVANVQGDVKTEEAERVYNRTHSSCGL